MHHLLSSTQASPVVCKEEKDRPVLCQLRGYNYWEEGGEKEFHRTSTFRSRDPMHSKPESYFVLLRDKHKRLSFSPKVIFWSFLKPAWQVQVTHFHPTEFCYRKVDAFIHAGFVVPSSAIFNSANPLGKVRAFGCPCSVYLRPWLSILQGIVIAAQQTSWLLTWDCHVTMYTSSVWVCV